MLVSDNDMERYYNRLRDGYVNDYSDYHDLIKYIETIYFDITISDIIVHKRINKVLEKTLYKYPKIFDEKRMERAFIYSLISKHFELYPRGGIENINIKEESDKLYPRLVNYINFAKDILKIKFKNYYDNLIEGYQSSIISYMGFVDLFNTGIRNDIIVSRDALHFVKYSYIDGLLHPGVIVLAAMMYRHFDNITPHYMVRSNENEKMFDKCKFTIRLMNEDTNECILDFNQFHICRKFMTFDTDISNKLNTYFDRDEFIADSIELVKNGDSWADMNIVTTNKSSYYDRLKELTEKARQMLASHYQDRIDDGELDTLVNEVALRCLHVSLRVEPCEKNMYIFDYLYEYNIMNYNEWRAYLGHNKKQKINQ